MTRAALSPVTRETDAFSRPSSSRQRPLIVTINARTLTLREKGRREEFVIHIDAVYDLARKLAARAKMR